MRHFQAAFAANRRFAAGGGSIGPQKGPFLFQVTENNALAFKRPKLETYELAAPMNELVAWKNKLVAPMNELVAPSYEFLAVMNELATRMNKLVARKSELAAPNYKLVAAMNELVVPMSELVARKNEHADRSCDEAGTKKDRAVTKNTQALPRGTQDVATVSPGQSPKQTAVGAGSSAVASRRRFGLIR
jgi:hypothetical protein